VFTGQIGLIWYPPGLLNATVICGGTTRMALPRNLVYLLRKGFDV
jgi:hypothetical protein